LFGNLKFPQAEHGLANFRLKPQNATHFAKTWATSNRVGEQVYYKYCSRAKPFGELFCRPALKSPVRKIKTAYAVLISARDRSGIKQDGVLRRPV
jgi:hypothetical protein